MNEIRAIACKHFDDHVVTYARAEKAEAERDQLRKRRDDLLAAMSGGNLDNSTVEIPVDAWNAFRAVMFAIPIPSDTGEVRTPYGCRKCGQQFAPGVELDGHAEHCLVGTVTPELFADMEGFHTAYSRPSGWGFYAKTTSHTVNSETKKSLCGRNAADWTKMDWSAPDCERCAKSLAAIRPKQVSP